MKNYLLVCEIGPIAEFIRASRKTTDLWSASFVFSFIMRQVAIDVEEAGGKLIRPYLKNLPMYTGEGITSCGSIPDQFLVQADDSSLSEVVERMKSAVRKAIRDLLSGMDPSPDEIEEVLSFFRFVYTITELPGSEASKDDYERAGNAIAARNRLNYFTQKVTDDVVLKKQKCTLCGERIAGTRVERFHRRDQGPFREERLCTLCYLKRHLRDHIKSLLQNVRPPDFLSTADIGFLPISQILDSDDEERREFDRTCAAVSSKSSDFEDRTDADLFFDISFASHFRDLRKMVKEGHKADSRTIWLDRPFFALVYLDGDGTGSMQRSIEGGTDSRLRNEAFSKALSQFSNDVQAVVASLGGQLVYAGGEDILYLIHPHYLLRSVNELKAKYIESIRPYAPVGISPTISAGAVISYYKYPLSLVVDKVAQMLECEAKKFAEPASQPKNAIAISLIKGHTENVKVTLSMDSLMDLIWLVDCYVGGNIPRGFPYKLEESKLVLESLASDHDLFAAFLSKTLSASREEEGNPESSRRDIVQHFQDLAGNSVDRLVGVLLLARFLGGGN